MRVHNPRVPTFSNNQFLIVIILLRSPHVALMHQLSLQVTLFTYSLNASIYILHEKDGIR